MADNNLAEKLAAMTCEGCRLGWPLHNYGSSYMHSGPTAGDREALCTSKAPELLTLVGEVEAAAYGRAAQSFLMFWKALIELEPHIGLFYVHLGDKFAADFRALAPVGLAEHDREIRLEEAEECAKSVCEWCRSETGILGEGERINPTPQKFEKETYIENCGDVIGWQHHQSWGGFRKCKAAEVNERLAALRREEPR